MWKIEFYQESRSKQWRWRLRNAGNGKIVADSAEAYVTRYGVLRALTPLATSLTAQVWEAFTDGRRSRQIAPPPNVLPMRSSRSAPTIEQRVQDDTRMAEDGRQR